MPDIKNKIAKDIPLIEYIKTVLKEYPKVELPLVLAIIETESNFKSNAYRYEAHINDASYGLMQILYSTARWLSFNGKPEELFIPEINILCGVRYINWLIMQGLDEEGIIMSYNEGIGNYRKGKRVYSYYAKVKARYEAWRLFI